MFSEFQAILSANLGEVVEFLGLGLTVVVRCDDGEQQSPKA